MSTCKASHHTPTYTPLHAPHTHMCVLARTAQHAPSPCLLPLLLHSHRNTHHDVHLILSGAGTLDIGYAPLIIHGAKVSQTVGVGATAGNMHISNEELLKITAGSGFAVSGPHTGTITVDGVIDEQSANIFPLVTFLAAADGAQVVFDGTSSTFHALAAQADDGVRMKVNQTSTYVSIYLDGDVEEQATGDAVNQVQFDDGIRVQSRRVLTLKSTTGSIVPLGSLTLKAGSGVVILDDMVSSGTAQPLVMLADYDSTGDGTLTIASSATLDSSGNPMLLTAWDLDLQGELTSGSATTQMYPVHEGQTFGLGSTAQNMHISDTELGRVTTSAQFIVGSSTGGSISIDGVTEDSSTAAAVRLIATNATRMVVFETTASTFNKGVVVQAMGGIVLSESLNARLSDSLISAGTGTLTVASSFELSTSGQLLSITAQDIDLDGDISADPGALSSSLEHPWS